MGKDRIHMGNTGEDYAWFYGPRSASDRFKWVGRKKPNPLGLYDTLGNVEELTIESSVP